MFRILRSTLLALTLTFSVALAAGAHEPMVTVQADEVGTYTSAPGESYEAFVVRVAKILNTWTQQNGKEACGEFSKAADGTYAIQLTTERAQVMCIFNLTPLPGTTLVGDSLHSHPTPTDRSGDYQMTDEDRAAFKAVGDWEHAAKSNRWVHGDGSLADFSTDDYDSGPGFLVARGKLMYQHGRHTARVVSDTL